MFSSPMAARVSAVFRRCAAARWSCALPSPQPSRAFLPHRRDITTTIPHHLPHHLPHHSPFHSGQTSIVKRIMASDPAVDKILSGKYPAKQHASNVAKYIRGAHPEITDGLIYLESTKSSLHEDSDSEAPFRQRRYFYYLSGCDLPDSYLTYNLSTSTLTLYIPPINPSDVLWSGLPLSVEEAQAAYDVDAVKHTKPDLHTDIGAFAVKSSPSEPIFVIAGQVSVSVPQVVQGSLHTKILKKAIEDCRAIKDDYEVALIKKANLITTLAHHKSMQTVKSAGNERELEAVFTERCIANGAPKQAYHGIFAAGRAAATLHYVHNNKPLSGKLNLLLDAGAEYNNYASDVTRTFPLSGTFSKESREIYDLVLAMQKATMAQCVAGVSWDKIHTLAHQVAVEGLLKLGILCGGSEEEIMSARTSCAFLPHGLGHLLGMDTHDTGGNPNYEDEDPMFKYLRKRGDLRTGEVITVEPGIYFCEFIIRPYLEDPNHSRYINKDVLEKYWDVGGVRIEDNILITDSGYENLTTAVKEVEDMYKLINGST